MKSNSISGVLLVFITALSLGFTLGAQSNSTRLASLASEPADISKMDWLLLRTQVSVLEQALKDDLALPLTSTGYSFDSDRGNIHTSVYVNPTWLSQSKFDEVKEALASRATTLCIAPTALSLADPPSFFALVEQPPVEYCSILFFTISLNAKGDLERKDISTFEDGKLIMK